MSGPLAGYFYVEAHRSDVNSVTYGTVQAATPEAAARLFVEAHPSPYKHVHVAELANVVTYEVDYELTVRGR